MMVQVDTLSITGTEGHRKLCIIPKNNIR